MVLATKASGFNLKHGPKYINLEEFEKWTSPLHLVPLSEIAVTKSLDLYIFKLWNILNLGESVNFFSYMSLLF